MTEAEMMALKPGDRVVVTGINEAAYGGLHVNGELYEVADPTHFQGGIVRVHSDKDGGRVINWSIQCLQLAVELPEPVAPCSCPMTTLMTGGCRCGAITREREAVGR